MKLNNKGMSIVEIVVTFALIMVMVIQMLVIVMNYREKVSTNLKELDLETFKDTLTRDIQKDILNIGVKEINVDGECNTNTELSQCINIVFNDGKEKAFGTSKIDASKHDTIENKYLYYDGLKYKLSDKLPDKIPNGRNVLDFQRIIVEDNNILSTDSIVLEDGTTILIYSIDIYISHIDFDKDFGIHIVTSVFANEDKNNDIV